MGLLRFQCRTTFYDAMRQNPGRHWILMPLAFPAGAASALHLVQAQVNP